MAAGILAIMEFGLFVFLASVAVSVVVALGAQAYAVLLENLANAEKLRGQLVTYSRIANGLTGRLEARKNVAAGAAAQLFASQRQEATLKKNIRELETAPYRFVRLAGNELLPNRAYEFLVINNSVVHQVRRGDRHAFYDNSWAQPQPVHVWALNMDEAELLLERVFPKTVGFRIVHGMALPERTDAVLAPVPAVPDAAMEMAG